MAINCSRHHHQRPLFQDVNMNLGCVLHAICNTKLLPQALMYLRRVAMEGECLPVANARSNRATAGAWVPTHALGQLRLGQTGLLPSFEQRVEENPPSSRSIRNTSACTPGRRINSSIN